MDVMQDNTNNLKIYARVLDGMQQWLCEYAPTSTIFSHYDCDFHIMIEFKSQEDYVSFKLRWL